MKPECHKMLPLAKVQYRLGPYTGRHWPPTIKKLTAWTIQGLKSTRLADGTLCTTVYDVLRYMALHRPWPWHDILMPNPTITPPETPTHE